MLHRGAVSIEEYIYMYRVNMAHMGNEMMVLYASFVHIG